MNDEIKVGDIITTYHKGYWRLTKIERRFLVESDLRFGVYKDGKVGDEYSPLYHYELVMDANGKKPKSKRVKSCDAAYCKKFGKKQIEEMKIEFEKRIADLETLNSSIEV